MPHPSRGEPALPHFRARRRSTPHDQQRSVGHRAPGGIARAAVVTPLPQAVPASRVGGRHSAPEFAEVMEVVASEFDVDRRGRHAEPAWGRELFDPRRDDDAFDWLGFTADQD